MSDSIATLKQDAGALLAVLNLERSGNHGACRFCGSSDALSTFSDGETWAFKCHSCGAKGDIIRAVALAEGISDGDAIKRLAERAPLSTPPRAIFKPKRPPAPLRNLDAETARARVWAEDLEHNPQALALLFTKRGIDAQTAAAWSVGVKDIQRDSSGAIIGATWTFPIVSHSEKRPLAGVKCHLQRAISIKWKSYWIPEGVKQSGFLFPLLEAQSLPRGAEVILTPGELKALNYLSCGIPATSRTAGEDANWPDELAARFEGLRVVIDPDRENSEASKSFVSKSVAALQGIATTIEEMQ